MFELGGDACSWGEALLLVESLRWDHSTHLGAALVGWERPATMTDVSLALLAFSQINKNTGKSPSGAVVFPWEALVDRGAYAPVPNEVRAEMKARMKQFSAFAE